MIRKLIFTFLLLFLFVLLLFKSGIATGKSDRIRIEDIQTITLHSDKWTNARRSSAIKQLTCVGGSAASHHQHHPSSVQCYNRGFDGTDVQWECKADLDHRVKFGQLEVSCEGYEYPDDPYVLAGSCGLEYKLEFLSGAQHHYDEFSSDIPMGTGFSLFSVLSKLFVIAVIFFIIYLLCCSAPTRQDAQDRDEPHRFGAGGGGGGGPSAPPYPPNDPPPPYSDTQKPSSSSSYGWDPNLGSQRTYPNVPGQYTQGAPRNAQQQQQQQQPRNDGPGFWTGLGLGGLGGYFMGGNRRRGYGGNYWGGGGGGWGGNRGWFGGSGGNRHHHGTGGSFFGGGGFGGSSSSSSSGTPSGSRSASGFASTRRR